MEQRASIQAPVWVPVSERLPKPGQFVRYRTKNFTFAGYCDEKGTWTDLKGKVERVEIIAWQEQVD